MNQHQQHISEIFSASAANKLRIAQDEKLIASIYAIAELLTETFMNGGKLLVCGNGGSAADAQHIAAEFMVRLRSEVDRKPLPAIALALDASSITACGNDYSFEDYFARMTEGLGKEGDCILGITTSGKSPNVLKAFKVAKEKGLKTIGLLGKDGGPALPLCDLAFVAPGEDTARIQEAHITAIHGIALTVEDLLAEKKFI